LKSLILLTAICRAGQKLKAIHPALYHQPLLMVLVNSVNTKDSDLKLFFRELVRIANGEIDETQWSDAKQELSRVGAR
jgi:hypothetical protein